VVEIDVDRDETSDFRILIDHHSTSCGSYGKCYDYTTYNTFVRIEGLNPGDSLNTLTHLEILHDRNWFFEEGDSIRYFQPERAWMKGMDMLLSGGCWMNPLNYENTYIGIMTEGRLGWLHITTNPDHPVRELVLLDYAVRTAQGIGIVAGQTQ
jgi:hypothetical protein